MNIYEDYYYEKYSRYESRSDLFIIMPRKYHVEVRNSINRSQKR